MRMMIMILVIVRLDAIINVDALGRYSMSLRSIVRMIEDSGAAESHQGEDRDDL
jgi:hypothetical protein